MTAMDAESVWSRDFSLQELESLKHSISLSALGWPEFFSAFDQAFRGPAPAGPAPAGTGGGGTTTSGGSGTGGGVDANTGTDTGAGWGVKVEALPASNPMQGGVVLKVRFLVQTSLSMLMTHSLYHSL